MDDLSAGVEIKKNGYEVISGKSLKEFKLAFAQTFGEEANFPTKTTILGTFNFRAFLNLAMLLEKSDRAREVRSLVLDIVLDTINSRTGGNTKYINQRDEDFVFNLLQYSQSVQGFDLNPLYPDKRL